MHHSHAFRLATLWRILGAALLLMATGYPAAAATPRAGLIVSTQEVPLVEQVLQRMRRDITTRLGKAPLTRDRFFITPFAYQNAANDPAFSHSFMTLVRVMAPGAKSTRGAEYFAGRFGGWNFEAFTISWLPADFAEDPTLCVFSGWGARLIPQLNRCPIEPGKNYNLRETLAFAAEAKVAVGMWGPYEVAEPAYELGLAREKLLESGTIQYRADDRLYRKPQVAINCFRAMSNLDQPAGLGGLFNTGFRMWGLNGTKRVLLEYTTRGNRKHLLLEPVNIRDVDGFVYLPPPGSKQRPYNPFRLASGYRH